MSHSKLPNLTIIVGDRFFSDLEEHSVITSLGPSERQLLDWSLGSVPQKDVVAALSPSLFSFEPRLVILRDPPKKIIPTVASACKNDSSLRVIVSVEQHDADASQEPLKSLKDSLFNPGFILGDDEGRFLSAVGKLEEIGEVTLSEGAKSALFRLCPRIKRSIPGRNGKPTDTIVLTLVRMRSELQKAQSLAGSGPITPEILAESLPRPWGEDDLWKLVDAAVQGDLAVATFCLDGTASGPEDAHRIIGLIENPLQIIGIASGQKGRTATSLEQTLDAAPRFEGWEATEKTKGRPARFVISKALRAASPGLQAHSAQALRACDEAREGLRNDPSLWRSLLPLLFLRIKLLS
jgi:hypothetical protein